MYAICAFLLADTIDLVTRRSYRNHRATSPDGRLCLEVTSPENGPGFESPDRGSVQRNFWYRLTNSVTKEVCWERQQAEGEGSPVEVFLSSEGHAVVVAHHLSWATDQLLFIDRAGKKRLVLLVSPAHDEADDDSEEGAPDLRVLAWTDSHVHATTAGPRWRAGSLATFGAGLGHSWFALRTAWGRRITVDLDSMSLAPEVDGADVFRQAVLEVERRDASKVLLEVGPAVCAADADLEPVMRAFGALGVVIDQRLDGEIATLRELERSTWVGLVQSCVALGPDSSSKQLTLRCLARLALRHFGESPSADPGFVVTRKLAGASRSSPMGYQVDAWERALATPYGADAESVLAHLGAPDFIQSYAKQVDNHRGLTEVWSYDGPPGTTRLWWSMPESSRPRSDQPRRVVRVDTGPDWRRPERWVALLGLGSRLPGD